jgi:fatty acid desaturase
MHGWQSVCQHYGMGTGRAPDVSRDVAPQSVVGRVICWFLFHENYHSAHHAAPNVPAAKLPDFYRRWTERLRQEGQVVPPAFRSYHEILRTQVIPSLIRDAFPANAR